MTSDEMDIKCLCGPHCPILPTLYLMENTLISNEINEIDHLLFPDEICIYRRKAQQIYTAFSEYFGESTKNKIFDLKMEIGSNPKCSCGYHCQYLSILHKMEDALETEPAWELSIDILLFPDEPCRFRRRAKQLFEAFGKIFSDTIQKELFDLDICQ